MNISKEEICKQMKQVFIRTTEMDFSWNWSAGVAFYGIVRAWEVTGETEYIEYLKEWVDAYIEAGIPKFTINAVSIGYALMALHGIPQIRSTWIWQSRRRNFCCTMRNGLEKVCCSTRFRKKIITSTNRPGQTPSSWRGCFW